jgi:hypothetical protein
MNDSDSDIEKSDILFIDFFLYFLCHCLRKLVILGKFALR